MKVQQLGFALLAAMAIATPAEAVLIAYEGFAGVGDGALAGQAATGVGFTGQWDITNGDGVSTTEAGGLSYPASYPATGLNVAVGGNGRVTGEPGQNAFLALDLDPVSDNAVNTVAGVVYMSFLAEMVGQTVTEAGVPAAGQRAIFNLASEYPRNQGIRINNTGNGSNDSLGTIGKGSDWNSNGVTFGDPNPLIIDTWGAANFNDVNRLYTGADFADGTDHVVMRVDKATSRYTVWVNPQLDGSSDGSISFIHTDGGSAVPFVLKAFGVEAGNNSSDRPVGDMVFDEIRIGTSFYSVAGFNAPATSIPEPSSIAVLLGMIGMGCGAMRRR